jgi:4-diphosphocytidyl-2-C-methyl-D-erythritol kinase
MTRLTVKAHAKINLNLKVLGKRTDGFHDLLSVMQTVTIHDRVTLEATAGGIDLSVDDPAVPADADNLACRAAARLPGPPDEAPGLRIHLEKVIPAGAGMGGGSSDAAATLLGLCRLRGLSPRPEVLEPIAAALGSDVPFFLQGGTALATGRGTEVRPLPDLLGYRLLIVFPGESVPTAEAYARLRRPLTPDAETSTMARFKPAFEGAPEGDVEAWVSVGNDLEPCARELCPAIGEIKDRLIRAGATAAAMTGSGSAVFGVYRDPDRLEQAARELERPGWTVFRCAPLGRRDYRRGLGLA